jgi:hypothetical protein
VSAQRVQHEILIEFANRGRGESVIPIMQKLRQDRRQMESLLVTSTGVVVNGNRRLAAMRELFADEPGSYPFQLVEVAVLPKSVTPPDLKKIEFQLQMQQETKLPYDWAIQCLSVRELAESGVSQEEIQHMMRLTRVEDIQAMINRLNEAEMYLSDYLQTPEDPTKTAQADHPRLRKGRRSRIPASRQAEDTAIGNLVLEESATSKGDCCAR